MVKKGVKILFQVLEKFNNEKPYLITKELILLNPKDVAIWIVGTPPKFQAALISNLPTYFNRILLNDFSIEKLKILFEFLDLNRVRYVFYALSTEKKHLLIKQLSDRVKVALNVKKLTIKDTLRVINFDMATSINESATIEEVIRLIKNGHLKPSPDIYVCDRENKLLSRISLNDIISAPTKKLPVGKINLAKAFALRVDQSFSTALKHPGFLEYDTLPILDEQNLLLGSIRFRTLCDISKAVLVETASIDEIALESASDVFVHSLNALASLYDSVTFEKQTNEHR